MAYRHKLSCRLALLRDLLLRIAPLAAAIACERTSPALTAPAPHVVQIVVVPESVTLDPTQQIKFGAFGRSSNGDSTAVAVTWTASSGTIAPDGMYTADTVAGDFLVTATNSQLTLSGSSRVRNRGRRPVASVTVSPAAASVTVGQTVQLVATPKDAQGNPLNGRVVTWATTNAAVATVTGNGLVTGVTAGSVTIAATSEGQSGTAAVTVSNVPVASVTVSPATASLIVGQTLQLTATAKDANGNVLMGRVVTWASNNVGVATVNAATGLVTAVALGTAVITAVCESQNGTAAVTATKVPVASVTVSPGTASVTAGQTVQLTATPKDASGNPLSGRVVIWASGNTAVATVNSTGLVTGVAPGLVTVTATSEGQGGSAMVTVTAVGSGSECATPQPAWIWCDDFEQNRLGQYFEYDSANGSFTRVAGVGRNGSYGMRASYATGQVSNGSLHLAFGKTPQAYMKPVDAGTALYSDLYWRFYIKYQAGWVGGMGGKLTRSLGFVSATNFNSFHYGQSYELSDGQTLLSTDPASGTDAAGNLVTTGYNDFAHMRFLGQTLGSTPIFDSGHVGQWYCLEYHVKLNTPGQSDGMFEVWVNGALDLSQTGLNWRGTYQAWGINAVYLENYWNSGSPRSQSRYFDSVVVSTQRIGC